MNLSEMDGTDPVVELEESEALRDRMSEILRDTADALHGGPLENGFWSWHDLPTLAATLYETVTIQIGGLDRLERENTNLRALVVEQQTISENPNRDAAYVEHLASARAMGVTPLDFDSFKAEDRRIVTEWQRRRRGVDSAEADYAKTAKTKFTSFIDSMPNGYTTVLGFWRRLRFAWRMIRRGEFL